MQAWSRLVLSSIGGLLHGLFTDTSAGHDAEYSNKPGTTSIMPFDALPSRIFELWLHLYQPAPFPKAQGWPSLVSSSTGGWQHSSLRDTLVIHDVRFESQPSTSTVGHDAVEGMGRLPLLYFQVTFPSALSTCVLEAVLFVLGHVIPLPLLIVQDGHGLFLCLPVACNMVLSRTPSQ